MRIESNMSGDDFFDSVMAQAIADAERHHAAGLAQIARENGMSTVDEIELEITVDDPSFKVDEARIRRLANEELARDEAGKP